MEENKVFIKAIEKTSCPYKNEDGVITNSGGCPCAPPHPCEQEVLIPIENLKEMIGRENESEKQATEETAKVIATDRSLIDYEEL